jgi:transposase, IS5 family
LNRDPVPDATTVLHFRHWLERHELTQGLFDEVGAMLEERGLLMRQGTIVDATIIAAPPSTKSKQQSRDPEMHQTKKGNQWHFGMPFDRLRSAHRRGCRFGAGPYGGRHRRQQSRHYPDGETQTAKLLHRQEEAVFGDAGYNGTDKRPELADRDVSGNIALKRRIIKALAQA